MILFLSFGCAIIYFYFFRSSLTSLDFLSGGIECAVLACVFYKAIQYISKNGIHRKKFVVTLSILFSIFLCLGKELSVFHDVYYNIQTLLSFLVLVGMNVVVMNYFLNEKFVLNWKQYPLIEGANSFFSSIYKRWSFIFLCWIPIFLAAFPGYFTYDASAQFDQFTLNQMSLHHPPFHTLIMNIMILVGDQLFPHGINHNNGIAFYILFEMVVISGFLPIPLGE